MSFYSEIVLKDLVFQIKGSVEQVPYPSLIELLFMKLTIELIRETGIRLPAPIGQTIGIVGAGLVSNFAVIVVILTTISSYFIP
ncbi:spore germination protein [Domibacillus sp. 8LH]|uniref:spore germination protein n=1 Tax=Domibacillus sp. 8LH TaxID=3073900 RepID=UPI0031765182